MYKRSNSALTAPLETRALQWIAGRLPDFARPNRLPALGVLGGLLSCVGYVLSSLASRWLVLAVLGYGLHWFGDSLDGTLARLRRIERPLFGTTLDQVCDVLTLALTFLGL